MTVQTMYRICKQNNADHVEEERVVLQVWMLLEQPASMTYHHCKCKYRHRAYPMPILDHSLATVAKGFLFLHYKGYAYRFISWAYISGE